MGDRCFAFICHPYHHGELTQWMVDAAEEMVSQLALSDILLRHFEGKPILALEAWTSIMLMYQIQSEKFAGIRIQTATLVNALYYGLQKK